MSLTLFTLPPELLSRDLARVMRIQLVNREFTNPVNTAFTSSEKGLFRTFVDSSIFRLGLLSTICGAEIARHLLLPRRHVYQGWLSYVHSYLTYQVLREPSTTSLFGQIRLAAQALCGQGSDLTCLTSLVHLAAIVNPHGLLRESPTKSQELDKCSDLDLKADICVAAVYLGQKEYVERLIAEGTPFFATATRHAIDSRIFGGAFRAATRSGNLEMIKLLLLCIIPVYRRTLALPPKFQRDILQDASNYNDQAAFEFALDMRPILPSVDKNQLQPHSWTPMEAPSLTGFIAAPVLAWILLDAGADPRGSSPWHTPLMEAAWKRSVDIAKTLLDHGADVNTGCPPPIVIAVLKEHLDMFRLLRDHGARLDTPETGGWAMAVADTYGLSSMKDLLVQQGVGQDVILHRASWKAEWEWSYSRMWP
ncbi:hypothetical protein HD806DRAFT_526784 [Xylariaceae sp. AK1471]|nr:hypothetical protein HD806DRAFT_526784 [Xylariaceae sp. AK1471]